MKVKLLKRLRRTFHFYIYTDTFLDIKSETWNAINFISKKHYCSINLRGLLVRCVDDVRGGNIAYRNNRHLKILRSAKKGFRL